MNQDEWVWWYESCHVCGRSMGQAGARRSDMAAMPAATCHDCIRAIKVAQMAASNTFPKNVA